MEIDPTQYSPYSMAAARQYVGKYQGSGGRRTRNRSARKLSRRRRQSKRQRRSRKSRK